ncbi:DUF421 domain-containing protein [Metabacillus indicus]|uniref:DUF421 domain-containing protein n=1 Tax=Metabacillus indicus TaxID=246786 RepID=UPI0024904249|nr:DUF421 domain-containing protein [Metabacillus indicus]
MSFFEGQDTLTAFQWSIRAVIAFFFLVLAAKAMGQRSISQLRLLDFVIALIIGNIVAHPLADHRTGMAGSMITMSVLIFLYVSSIFISLKFPVFRKMMNAAPITIIHEGTNHPLRPFKKSKIDAGGFAAGVKETASGRSFESGRSSF